MTTGQAPASEHRVDIAQLAAALSAAGIETYLWDGEVEVHPDLLVSISIDRLGDVRLFSKINNLPVTLEPDSGPVWRCLALIAAHLTENGDPT